MNRKEVEFEFCPTQDMIAYLFTKPFEESTVHEAESLSGFG
jgi:hypothetical protein